MKPVVVVSEGLEDIPFAWLRENATVREVSWKDPAVLNKALADADALIVRTYTLVTEALLAAGPKLRVVGRAGVGLDNIDQAACERRGVKVLSTPTANTRAVCEYVFNLIFHLGRPLVNLTSYEDAEAFHKYRKTVRGLELSGKTMGILGMGRIGRGVGKIARAMQMNVLYTDLVDVASKIDYPARSASRDDLLEQADVLTVHVSHVPGNAGMLNAKAFSRMKPSALFLNTSRGEVVVAKDLAVALKTNQIAGAAIDVHEPEPPPPDYPLWGCPNLIFAPHLAARTQGAMDSMSWVARDVVEALKQN